MVDEIKESEALTAIRDSMRNLKEFLEEERDIAETQKTACENKIDLYGSVYFASKVEWFNTFMEMLDTGEEIRAAVEK